MLRNQHVSRLGHPLANHGALYHVSDLDGLVLSGFDIELARIASHGIVATQMDMAEILAEINQSRFSYERMIEALGIPDGIASLMSATKKKDANRIARKLTISENELFLLVHNHRQIGYTHRSKFPEFVPEYLQITDSDSENLHSGMLNKFSKKISSLFKFRKHIHAHMFEKAPEWHCFYFSYDDIEESGENHWKEGPHLHYVSHLWPRIHAEQMWQGFESRRIRASSGLHIRFHPFIFPDSAGSSFFTTGSAADQMFPPDKGIVETDKPTPPAQIFTRGVWTANISVPINLELQSAKRA